MGSKRGRGLDALGTARVPLGLVPQAEIPPSWGMSLPEEALGAYLQRVQAAAQAKDAAATLRPEALEAIALELGLSPSDLAAAQEALAEHRTRGEAFLRHGRPQDALPELMAALALLPSDATLMLRLAEAHLGCHQANQEPASLAQAQAWVRRAIAQEPQLTEAYALLNRLDPPTAPPFPVSPRWASLAAGVAALALALGFTWFLWRPHGTAAPSPPVAAGARVDLAPQRLPLRLGQAPPGLSLEARASRFLVTQDGRAFLTLSMWLDWEGEGELAPFKGQLVVRDGQGKLLQRPTLDLLPSHEAPRLPGDRIAFTTTLALPPEARDLELRIEEVALRPVIGRPKLGESFALAWDLPQPPGVTLSAARRQEGLPAPGVEPRYAQPLFSVLNRGARPVHFLVLELSLLDARGEAVATRRRHVVHGEGMSLDPGRSALVPFILQAPPSSRSMRLSVVELR